MMHIGSETKWGWDKVKNNKIRYRFMMINSNSWTLCNEKVKLFQGGYDHCSNTMFEKFGLERK